MVKILLIICSFVIISSAHGDTTKKCLEEHPVDPCHCDPGPPCAGAENKTIKKNKTVGFQEMKNKLEKLDNK